MTRPLVSFVELVDIKPRLAAPDIDGNVIADLHGTPRITGNWLVENGAIKLINRDGETYIIASPLEIEGESFMFLSFGTLGRNVAHVLTLDGLQLVADNLNTMLALARLEENKGEA